MSETVCAYYNDFALGEWERLKNPYTHFEFITTMSLIEKYMQGNSVLDVGAGPGVYSIELMKRDCSLTLWDLSDTLLSIAKEKIGEAGFEAEEYICKNAAELITHDKQYDSVLMLGPLYHTLGEEKRDTILKGLHKVLNNGGVAFVAFLNSWGVMRACIHEVPEEYENRDFLHRYLHSFERSIHDPGEEGFTDVYLTTPPEAKVFLEKHGFTVLTYAGVEGVASGMEQAVREMALNHPEAYKNLVEIIPETGETPPFRDMTEHTVFVIRKN